MRFCVTLAEQNIHTLRKIIPDYPFAEIRIDAIEAPYPDDMIPLFSIPAVLVATCRSGEMEEGYATELLRLAVEGGAKYIDLDIYTPQPELESLTAFARENDCRVILSYHNYEKTPETDELARLIRSAQQAGADIVKIACMAHSHEDGERMLSLYDTYQDIIAFCMGETGSFTRWMSLVRGAPFAYVAPVNGKPAAPGQLTIGEMEKALAEYRK